MGHYETSFTRAIRRLGLAVERASNRILDDYDLTLPQFAALGIYASNPGITNNTASRAMEVSPQSLMAVTQALVDKGMIQRNGFPNSGRALFTHVTTLGFKRLAEAEAALAQVDETIKRHLPPTLTNRVDEIVWILDIPKAKPVK